MGDLHQKITADDNNSDDHLTQSVMPATPSTGGPNWYISEDNKTIDLHTGIVHAYLPL